MKTSVVRSLIVALLALLSAPVLASVPAAYLEVEYLESTGTQYIDTGVVVETNDDVTAVYKFLTHPNNENWVFASWSGGNNLRCGINSSGYYCGHADMTVTTDSSTGWSTATRTKYTTTKSGYTDYLYAQHGSGSTPGHLGCSIQIKRYTVTRDSAVCCDLVPCMRASDRVCGFYDLVSGDFKMNLGSGDDFTAGPMVAPGTGGILVAGDPYDLGTSTPTYGIATVPSGLGSFSLAGTVDQGVTWYLNSTGDRRGMLTSYAMTLNNTNVVATGSTVPFEYAVPAEYDALKLVWTFSADLIQSKVSSSGSGGSVTVGGESGAKWCVADETVSLAATPDDGNSFYKWTGSGITSANERDNPVTITVGADPMTPTPVFLPILFVSAADGDDVNGDGSRTSPYATITNAIAHAVSGTEIRVRGGLYEENLVDSTLDDLTILGGYDANWNRDLKNAQTFVMAAEANKPVVTISGEMSGIRLGGLVLTGGSYGIKTEHLKGHVFEQLVISNNTSEAINFSDTSFDRNYRMVLASCLIAYNKGGLREQNCGWSRPWYIDILSCTFLDTGTEFSVVYGTVTFRNNIFSRLSGEPTAGNATGNLSAYYYNNCIANGTAIETKYPDSVKAAVDNIYDPAGVNADGTLSDASPCLKVGDDLSTNETYAVTNDLYGTAWGATYDMGCIKSDYEPYVPKDIHVAADGDDSTGDGTAAKPYATIAKAIDAFKFGDRVLVQGGLYSENVVNTNVSDITVLGSYDADWKRDLKNARTVIKAADATQPALKVDEVWRNTWNGFDLTGGTYGLYVKGNRFHVFEHLSITNNATSGIYEEPNYSDTYNTSTMLFAHLLVADNAGYAITPQNGSRAYPTYWYNCTFANNKSGMFWGYGDFIMRNCICHNPAAASEFGGTGNTLLDLGGCCIRDGLYGSCDKIIQAEPETLTVDPKFESGYRLSSESLCIKRGADFSSLTTYEATNDLEGVSWAGAYDMGCFKSDYPYVPGVTRLKDVYVTTDGDDGEGDGTEEKPVATILRGLYLTDEGGTCHVGPGSFKGGVTLERAGMTLAGSGMGVTIVTNGSITVGTHDGTVRDLSVRWIGINPETGIVISQAGLVTNATVAYCEIANWSRGISAGDTGDDASKTQCDTHTYRFSHLVVTNSGVYGGIFVRGNLTIDNCLIATNMSSGLQVYSGQFRAYNCTIADNYGSSSFAMGGPGFSTTVDQIAVNCLFTGSDISFAQDLGGLAERKIGVFSNCLFNCTHLSYNTRLKCDEGVAATNDCIFGVAPGFEPRHGNSYRLGGTAPARRSGLDLSPLVPSVSDLDVGLDGITRSRGWDMGAYVAGSRGFLLLVR